MSNGLNYQPYTSPKKSRTRPESVISLPGGASDSFVRPSAAHLPNGQHARSQSVQLPAAPIYETQPVASTSRTPASTSRPSSPSQLIRSTASSPTPSSPRTVRVAPGRAPYLPGFQPAGVARSRTDEFVAERIKRGENRRMEGVRIGRRLSKVLDSSQLQENKTQVAQLVELHFPDPLLAIAPAAPPRGALARATSVRNSLSVELDSLRSKSASEVWGRMLRGVKGAKAEDLRAAEQAIVKWQDDETAKRCAICSVPFSFQVRKHHCRLCGRVVCFLPPTGQQIPPAPGSPALPLPVRPVRCSTFVRYEYDGPVKDAASEKPVPAEARGQVVELEVRENEPVGDGVRVCRECLAVVLRRQAVTHPPRTPNYIKLHEVLLQLQQEIEAALPELQEIIIALSRPNPSAAAQKAALNAQKTTLASLASYDSLAKRIRDLPDTPPGSSRDRLQRAIAARAQIFLADKFALLKGLGFDELQNAPPRPNAKSKGSDSKMTAQQKKEVEERAAKLAVLLEQEQLVQSYWEDANAKRQLEDATSLKASLDELRSEIRTLRETN